MRLGSAVVAFSFRGHQLTCVLNVRLLPCAPVLPQRPPRPLAMRESRTTLCRCQGSKRAEAARAACMQARYGGTLGSRVPLSFQTHSAAYAAERQLLVAVRLVVAPCVQTTSRVLMSLPMRAIRAA